MSLKIITKLIHYLKEKLNVTEDDIIINEMNIKDSCDYEIEMKIKDNWYRIKHFEPLHPIQERNYGMGSWYELRMMNQYGWFVEIESDGDKSYDSDIDSDEN